MEYSIHKWCAAQSTDVTARFIDGRWTVFDWSTHRLLARGTAIEVLRVLRSLPGYRQPLERASTRSVSTPEQAARFTASFIASKLVKP